MGAIAGILGMGMDVVEVVERVVDTLVERRVSGAKAPAPGSVRGSEEPRGVRRRRGVVGPQQPSTHSCDVGGHNLTPLKIQSK